MRSNKLTKKRAARLAEKQSQAEPAGQLLDGTEVLKSVEARQKVRRWSFEADIELVFPTQKNEDGTEKEGPVVSGMKRTMKLEVVSYSTAKEARNDCKTHEAYLRNTNQLFAQSKINVRAIPHETISNITLNQIIGYRDMSMILDRALGMVITQAEEVVLGKSLGRQFVQMPAVQAVAATDTAPAVEAKPETNLAMIKEEFYKLALIELRRQEPKANEGTDGLPGAEQLAGEVIPVVEQPESSESFAELRERMLAEGSGSDSSSQSEGQTAE